MFPLVPPQQKTNSHPSELRASTLTGATLRCNVKLVAGGHLLGNDYSFQGDFEGESGLLVFERLAAGAISNFAPWSEGAKLDVIGILHGDSKQTSRPHTLHNLELPERA